MYVCMYVCIHARTHACPLGWLKITKNKSHGAAQDHQFQVALVILSHLGMDGPWGPELSGV